MKWMFNPFIPVYKRWYGVDFVVAINLITQHICIRNARMLTERYIEFFFAGLVTRVALAFPVAYIRSIAVFNNEDKIADCTWEDERKGIYRTYQPVVLPVGLRHIVVEAIDANGEPMRITTPVDAI